MDLKELGGEFEFIKRVTGGIVLPEEVLCGVGDDCAVIRQGGDRVLLVTADMMVENDHFSLKWQTPYQVGMKLMEVNVSDIHAMGGRSRFAFISMSLVKGVQVEFMDELYRGLYDRAKIHGVAVLGGDTTHGTELVFNLTLLGEAEAQAVRYRRGAAPGEWFCVTGDIGGSTAGLKCLLRGKEKGGAGLDLSRHLEPKARLHREALAIARYATAMIDVSDGLASEVKHICRASHVGGVIFAEKIPLSGTTRTLAAAAGEDPLDCALYGGEDFELVFTVKDGDLETLRWEFSDFTVVGRVLPADDGVYLDRGGRREELKKGYDHFA